MHYINLQHRLFNAINQRIYHSRQSSLRRMVFKVQRNGITINTMQQISTTIVATNWTNPRTWYQRSVPESSLHTTVTAPDGFEGIKGDEL